MSIEQEDRLKIADRFSVIPVSSNEFRLHSLTSSLSLKDRSGTLLSCLLPLLDGDKSVQEVLAELERFGRDAVSDSLDYLMRAGVLERVVSNDQSAILSRDEIHRFRDQIAFFSHFLAPKEVISERSSSDMPKNALEYQQRIKKTHIAVFGVGRLGSQLIRSLALAGVGRITAVDSQSVSKQDINCDAWFGPEQEGMNRAEAVSSVCDRVYPYMEFNAVQNPIGHDQLLELLGRCDFAVLCPDHFNPTEYEEFNEASLKSKTSWTSARLSGFEFHIGPTVIPNQTPCFHCFTLRLKSNIADYSDYILLDDYQRKSSLQNAMLAITPGVGLLSLEILKAITWFMAPATCAHLYSLNLLTFESGLHPILKIPRCPYCAQSTLSRPTINAWQQSRTVQPS